MTEKEVINEWIKSGANVKVGVRIFIMLRGETPFGRVTRRHPDGNSRLAIRALFKIAEVEPEGTVIIKSSGTVRPLTIEATEKAPVFREMFPFLGDPNCPYELKILAADKITAYRNAVVAHQKLADCTNLDACYITAKTIVENWIENELIFEELQYYGEMKKVLGKHPIFDEMKKIRSLRKAKAKDIFRQRKNLYDNINRIKFEIKRGDKPHLLSEREKRLRKYEHLLAEINRIIDDL